MAYKDFTGADTGLPDFSAVKMQDHITLQADGGAVVKLPDASFVQDADMSRDGMDLVLQTPSGTVVVEGYFAAEPAPQLMAPDGKSLTPELVNSFLHNGHEFAQNGGANDASPVGTVQEVTGTATVTRADGTKETLSLGMPIFEGDIIETAAGGGVNIVFIDETSFAISEAARLAIDAYVFDPATQSGEQNFSVLKGLFVFTSGLIGRDDPDDVHIQTPAGSIGIRGTIIAGNVDTGEITVVEGAIVLTDFQGNEVTLANQFETAKFTLGEGVQHVGQLSAADVAQRFTAVSNVSPGLFSVINDAAKDQSGQNDAGSNQNGNGNGAEIAPQDAGPQGPAPSAPGTNGSFGTGNGGLGPQGPATGPIGPQGPGPNDSNGANNGFGHGPGGNLPSSPPLQPLAPPLTPVSHAGPVFASEIAPEFLAGSEGLARSYNFGKEFGGGSPGDVLTYRLDQSTIDQLNAWANDGTAGANLDILSGGEGTGWSFNSATGQLTMNFHTAFQMSPGAMESLNTIVHATDQNGNSVSGSHVFEAYNQSVGDSNSLRSSDLTNIDNKVIVRDASANQYISVDSSDNNRIFLQNSDDELALNGTSNGNYIHLGNGINTAIIDADTYNNTIVGGDGSDKIILNTTQAHVYGGQGDDVFILELDSAGNNILSELSSGGMILDGGHGLSNAAAQLQGMSGSFGAGDALVISGAGNLDFSAILANNQIRGIDVLDMAGTGGSADGVNTIDLSLQNVLQMTDPHGTLVIRLGANDILNLAGFDNFTQTHDNNFSIDIDGSGSSYANENYDIYTNGDITILILQDGTGDAGTVTGL